MKRYSKEVKIGVTFIISVLLLYIGINFLKGSNVFTNENTYYTVLSNAGGVAPSSVISTNGYQIGTVKDVEYDFTHPNRIVLTLSITESLRIPKGSRAYLLNELLGGVSIDLRLADNREYYENGDTIGSGNAHGLMGQVENEMLPHINSILPKIDSLITAINTIATNPSLNKTLNNIESISSKLNTTVDEFNGLMHNDIPELMSNLQSTSNNVNEITNGLATNDYAQTIARIDSTVTNLHYLSSALTNNNSNIGQLLNDTMLYHNINEICTNINVLIEDVKTNPSRYINISVFGKK